MRRSEEYCANIKSGSCLSLDTEPMKLAELRTADRRGDGWDPPITLSRLDRRRGSCFRTSSHSGLMLYSLVLRSC